MDWNILIGDEIDAYLRTKQQLELKVERSNEYWQDQLDRGRITEGEGKSMTRLLTAIVDHMNNTEGLLKGIGWVHDTLQASPEEVNQLRRKVKDLELELQKHKVCRDPSLHPYIKLSDFSISDFK
jgi:hypothetical protein